MTMSRVLVGLCTFYATTMLALYCAGIRPAIPWSLLPLLILIVIPFALGATGAVSVVARYAGPSPLMSKGCCVLLGTMLLLAYRLDSPLFLLSHVVIFPIAVRSVWRSGLARPLTVMIAALSVGYASIWNLNYLAAVLSKDRVADAAVKALDLALYQLLFRGPVDYVGFFPIVRSEALFRVFESGYVLLLPEIFVVSWLWIVTQRDPIGFLRTFFTCYVIGLIVFAIYPVVGPCIQFPESFRPEFRGTLTFRLMEGMASEYTAALQRTSVNGLGYFVAIPSLHAALAVALQVLLRVSPLHFWAFLPINVVVASSTVILGYHYVVDMMAGVALGMLVTMPYWRRPRSRVRQICRGEIATWSLARERSVRE